jgi:hypothetical protein
VLAVFPQSITVGDIIRSVDGSLAPVKCVVGKGHEPRPPRIPRGYLVPPRPTPRQQVNSAWLVAATDGPPGLASVDSVAGSRWWLRGRRPWPPPRSLHFVALERAGSADPEAFEPYLVAGFDPVANAKPRMRQQELADRQVGEEGGVLRDERDRVARRIVAELLRRARSPSAWSNRHGNQRGRLPQIPPGESE